MLRNNLFLIKEEGPRPCATPEKPENSSCRIKEEYEGLQYLGIRAIKAFLGNDPLNGLKQPCVTTVHITVGKKKYFSYTFSYSPMSLTAV